MRIQRLQWRALAQGHLANAGEPPGGIPTRFAAKKISIHESPEWKAYLAAAQEGRISTEFDYLLRLKGLYPDQPVPFRDTGIWKAYLATPHDELADVVHNMDAEKTSLGMLILLYPDEPEVKQALNRFGAKVLQIMVLMGDDAKVDIDNVIAKAAEENADARPLLRALPTLKYWYKTSRRLNESLPKLKNAPTLDDKVTVLRGVSADIGDADTVGVDPDAVQYGVALSNYLDSVADHRAYGDSPERLFEAFIRGVQGDPFGTASDVGASEAELDKEGREFVHRERAARAILSSRYGIQF